MIGTSSEENLKIQQFSLLSAGEGMYPKTMGNET